MINNIINIAKEAGKIIMSYYANNEISFSYKEDNSPLTVADLASNKFIIKKLKVDYNFPIITEETPIEYNQRKKWPYFWLVDPLDGTKDFIEKNDQFTVNIALIKNNRPILGVVHMPVFGNTYWAEQSKGAFKNGKKIFNNSKRQKLIGTDSLFHSTKETKLFFQRNNIKNICKYGSSLKLCKLAEGEVDIYPRLNGTKEWDTAASDIIVLEAGCAIVGYPHRKKLVYNKKTFQNPFFVAYRKGIKWQ